MKKAITLLMAALICVMPSCMKKKEVKEVVMVIHARHGELSEKELTLRDVDRFAVAFTDPPEHRMFMIPDEIIVEKWPEAFEKVNPNASISYYSKDGKYREIPVELVKPRMERRAIVFEIKHLDSKTKIEDTENLGETAVFIDGVKCWNEGPWGRWCQ